MEESGGAEDDRQREREARLLDIKGTNRIEERVTQYIEDRAQWLVERTVDFIRTPSVSGSEGDAARLLVGVFKDRGMSAFIDKGGNVIGASDPFDLNKKEKSLLLFNVHLDTVPSGDPGTWMYDPFGGTVEDGKIYGRGACDTKGAWAPMILAMEAVKHCNIRLDGQVLFSGVVMEELTYCIGMKILLESTLKNCLPDYVVLGEPTGLNIAVGHKGRAELEITTHGTSCHASVPWKGENALYSAAGAISAVERLAREMASEPGNRLFGKSSLAMTDITCNPGARNVIPDSCTMYLDYRFAPGEQAEAMEARIKDCLEKEGVAGTVSIGTNNDKTYTGIPFRGKKYMTAFTMDEGHILVKTASEAVAGVLSRPPVIYRWNFATDGAYSMGVRSIPTIGFSPCEEHLAHVVDEHVRVDYMITAARVYAEMIIRLLGSPEQR